MIFHVNNNSYDLSITELNNKHFIDEGSESRVYKFGDRVFKIYKSKCPKNRLKEDSVAYLSKIKTKRLLLPKEKILDEDKKFIGYSMSFIMPGSKDTIKNMNMKDFINELKLLKQDLSILKDNNVVLDDINDNNYIYNNSIYFIDPGSFTINKKLPSRYIEIINRELLHEFIINNILFRTNKLTKNQKEKLYSHLPIDEYLCDTLDYDIDPNEQVSKYVKRIVK